VFNIDDPGQGLFFCPETNPKTEIRALAFLKNGIKETSFMIPPLEAGNYILKVKIVIPNGSEGSNFLLLIRMNNLSVLSDLSCFKNLTGLLK
jgi:hypothetical protein